MGPANQLDELLETLAALPAGWRLKARLTAPPALFALAIGGVFPTPIAALLALAKCSVLAAPSAALGASTVRGVIPAPLIAANAAAVE
jgi:hypothetical protein